jgi:glucose-6-phosphate 1-epimerase
MPTDDLAVLNRNFGAPERIAFRAGPAGYPVMALTERRGSCEIALYGAHLLSWRPLGHGPVLWLSRSVERVVSGKPIRGGIPICWPWFGPHPTQPKLPGHGFARLRRWRLMQTEYDHQRTSTRLQLMDDESTRAIWPFAFRLELHVTVSDTLQIELTTTNRDKQPMVVTQALHTYFLVSQIMNIDVRGLEGAAYTDTTAAAKHGNQHGALLIRGETDRVYRGTEAECVLTDPDSARQIVATKRGSHTTVVWNPWIEKARRLHDMASEDYRRFICIETANDGDDSVRLEPGAQHTLAVTLRVNALAAGPSS